jgi:hypothetical protein
LAQLAGGRPAFDARPGRVEFQAKRLAGGVLKGPNVHSNQLPCIRIAKNNQDFSKAEAVLRDRLAFAIAPVPLRVKCSP